MFIPQYRTVCSDINVTKWDNLVDEPLDTPEEAYAKICQYIHCIPNRIGYIDAPECGNIRTNLCHGGVSLFEDPRWPRHQYCIVEVVTPPETSNDIRAIYLDD